MKYAYVVRDDGEHIRCSLLQKSQRFARMSYWEVLKTAKDGHSNNRVEHLRGTDDRLNQAEAVKATTERAEAQTQLATGGAPSSKRDTSNRRNNRREEQQYQQGELEGRLRKLGNKSAPPAAMPVTQASRRELGYPELDSE